VACPFHRSPETYTPGKCQHARPEQVLPDGDWRLWVPLAGRGWGKTRTGAEAVREWSEHNPRIGLIGATMDDARDVMVEGESGIIGVFPPDRPARYIANRRRIEFPSGSIGMVYSADEPERLRGPQHHKLWMDEIAAWRYLQDAFDMAMLGLRLGHHPQAVLTSTPKPRPLVKELVARAALPPGTDPRGRVILTKGTTYENRANLADAFVREVIVKYEGTRLGRQELMAEVLEDVPGALWKRADIMYKPAPRIERGGVAVRDLLAVVVGVDPSVTNSEDSDECGIVVDARGVDGNGYTLADLSARLSPSDWARRAVQAYHDFEADRIVAEANNGGDLVSTVIAQIDPTVPVELVHASRGKRTRAEPVAALYEQGRWFHEAPFPDLEDQMTSYTGEPGMGSPDRMDAHVWAATKLFHIGETGWGSGTWGGATAATTA
jgi:phage terminase large subunit-like protein